jgi:hypothetical protein
MGRTTIADRATGDRAFGTTVLDAWIAQQSDPVRYRSELVDACSSPYCTYRAIRDVLVEDGHPATLAADRVRKWWHQQPEYRRHEHS